PLAVLETDGDPARLRPVENAARLTRVKAVRELVLHHVRQVLALEVGDLLVNDDLLFAAHLVHLEHDDIAGIEGDLAQGGHGAKVGPGWGGGGEDDGDDTEQAFQGTPRWLEQPPRAS